MLDGRQFHGKRDHGKRVDHAMTLRLTILMYFIFKSVDGLRFGRMDQQGISRGLRGCLLGLSQGLLWILSRSHLGLF